MCLQYLLFYTLINNIMSYIQELISIARKVRILSRAPALILLIFTLLELITLPSSSASSLIQQTSKVPLFFHKNNSPPLKILLVNTVRNRTTPNLEDTYIKTPLVQHFLPNQKQIHFNRVSGLNHRIYKILDTV